jgi:hypothetical protein
MDNTSFKIAFISLIAIFILSAFISLSFFSFIGIGLFIFFCLKFFFSLGKTIEIRDLMILVALLQWIVAPVLKYSLQNNDIFYFMAIPEEQYMSYAFPASVFFVFSLYLPGIYKKIDSTQQLKSIKEIILKYPKIDIIFIIIGIIATILEKIVPLNLRFFVFLIGGIRYVGLFFLVIGKRNKKWIIFAGVLFLSFLDSLRYAIFHELILWLLFLFIVIAFLYNMNTRQKLILVIPILIFVMLIQSVKFYLRAEISQVGNLMDRAGIFTNLISKELESGEKTLSNSNFEAAVDRINQGWIVARIMRYTPYYEPFANGETIITGIKASLLPRFLNPEKPKAGGRENFERFTGKKLSDNTSMGLSPLGEAYANFGVAGGIIFMFLLGIFYNGYIHIIIRLSKKFPSLILWLPLLFLQVVKAETDFVVVLNHIIKASMVVAFVIFIVRKFFRTNI